MFSARVHVLMKLASGIVLVLLALVATPSHAAGPHSVLVLHSYHKADWTDDLMEGIQSVFRQRGDVELRVEYMDTKTVFSPEYLDTLAEIYSTKYPPDVFDLVLTTDDNALSFALERRDHLFPGAPVVFCGVNRYDPKIRDQFGRVTGVLEKGDFAATLQLAGQYFPGPVPVYVIADQTPTSQGNLRNFEIELAETLPDDELVLLQDMSFDELRDQLTSGNLTRGFAFFISFWKDREGQTVEPGDLEDIFRASSVPVFGRSEWMVGRGSIGGMCVHGVSQGTAAAELASQILDGASPDDLSVVADSPNKFIFDYAEFRRHGLDPSALPEESILINAPQPFYRVDKEVAVLSLIAFVIGIVLVAGLAVVVRKLQRTKRSLRRSEQLYRVLVDNVDLGITLIDRDFQVVMTNAAQCRIFGKPTGYFEGRVCYQEFEKRDQVCDHCPGRKAMETGVAESVETKGVLEGGETIDVRIRAFPVRPEEEEISGFIEVVEDITAQKKAEEEKRRFDEQVQETQKLESLGVLAGGIAHDFNNLLVGILGNADLALMKMSPESPARDFVQRTATAAERAAELANQMLAYSGKGRFVIERLDLNVLVEEMAHLLETATSKNAQLRIQLESGLNPVEADASQLRQVVMNLITNASDAIGQREGVISLRTGVMEIDSDYTHRLPSFATLTPGRYCYFEVSDSGCGMDSETQRRLFEPFYTTKKSGRGLGLAAAQGIVRGHGGAISVYSELGKGTTIKVLLPAAQHGTIEEPAISTSVEAADSGVASGAILVVDDEAAVREVAHHLLTDSGYQVLEAVDGEDAVEIFRDRKDDISLVLLDMTMPKMGGEEAYRVMRSIRPAVKVILSSGYNEQEAIQHFSGKGLAGFLQKPYRGDKLIQAVNQALRGA